MTVRIKDQSTFNSYMQQWEEQISETSYKYNVPSGFYFDSYAGYMKFTGTSFFNTRFGDDLANINIVFNMHCEDGEDSTIGLRFFFKDIQCKTFKYISGCNDDFRQFPDAFYNTNLTEIDTSNWPSILKGYLPFMKNSYRNTLIRKINLKRSTSTTSGEVGDTTYGHDSAFEGCTRLKEIYCELPNFPGPEEDPSFIGWTWRAIPMNRLFAGCSYLRSIDFRMFTKLELTSSMDEIISGCDSLQYIIIQPGNEYYADLGNNRYQIKYYKQDGRLTNSYEIPYDIVRVEATDEYTKFYIIDDDKIRIYDQYDLDEYMSTHLDDNNVYQIGSNVIFVNDFNDTDFNFTNYIHSLPNYEELDIKINFAQETDPDKYDCEFSSLSHAFERCGSKTLEVTFGKHQLHNREFKRCFEASNLTKVTLNENLFSLSALETGIILYNMFQDCLLLEEVKIPPYIIEQESDAGFYMSNAFNGCINLKKITFMPCSEETLEYGRFHDATYAFAGCSSLEHIDISKYVKMRYFDSEYILDGFIDGCESLKTLTIDYDENDHTYTYDEENDQYYIIYTPEEKECLIPYKVLRIEQGEDHVTFVFKESKPTPSGSSENKKKSSNLAIIIAQSIARKNKLINSLISVKDPVIRSQIINEIRKIELSLKYIQDKFM